MCLFSLRVPESMTRPAVAGETLTVQELHQHRCLVGDDGKIACVANGTEVELVLAISRYAWPVSTETDGLIGTTVTARLMEGAPGYSADHLYLPNHRQYLPLAALARGTRVRVKVQDLDRKLGLDQPVVEEAPTEPARALEFAR